MPSIVLQSPTSNYVILQALFFSKRLTGDSAGCVGIVEPASALDRMRNPATVNRIEEGKEKVCCENALMNSANLR